MIPKITLPFLARLLCATMLGVGLGLLAVEFDVRTHRKDMHQRLRTGVVSDTPEMHYFHKEVPGIGATMYLFPAAKELPPVCRDGLYADMGTGRDGRHLYACTSP